MTLRMFEEKGLVERYAAFRPTYAEATYTPIYKFYEEGKGSMCNYDLAVDVGCGSGQSTRSLCNRFRHVIGCDISEAQIKAVPKEDLPSNLRFTICAGEKMEFLEDGSVDLVTIAAALHWLDTDAFFKEVTRVLKPGGVFATYCYLVDQQNALCDQNANDAMIQFHRRMPVNNVSRHYQSHVETRYSAIDFPFQQQLRMDLEHMCANTEMSVDNYIGFLSTHAVLEHPFLSTEAKHFMDLKRTLDGIYEDSPMKVKWPGFIILCRKPK